MKNLKFLFPTLLFFAFVSGFAQKKVAVVTFYADKSIDLSDIGMSDLTVISELLEDPTFNLQPSLQQFHQKFFNEYAKKFPFEITSETFVTGNEEYKNFTPEYKSGYTEKQYSTINGYKPVDHNYGRNNVKNLSKIFNDVDGIMFVYISFSLNKGFGIGGTATTKMQAYTNIALYNKKGEKVFSINESANSKKTGVMVSGVPVMKADKLLPMCESAIEQLMKDLDKRLQKIVDKSAKRL